MGYGLPYTGSKNTIAKEIVDALPKGGVFYDLFFGGGAVTHAAMLTGKWGRFVANDLHATPELFIRAANGELKNEKRWISREDFFRLKDTDEYVRLCWSFGNDGRTYLYGKQIEPYKKAYHYAAVFGDYTGLRRYFPDIPDLGADRLAIRRWILDWGRARGQIRNGHTYITRAQFPDELKRDLNNADQLQSLQSLESLESLERLQDLGRLERLQDLGRLESYQADYRDVPLTEYGIIYCDIPYRDKTNTYTDTAFDYDAFYDWCERQTLPVYISEEYMPEDRFVCIWKKPKRRSLSSADNTTTVMERLYTVRG